MVSALSSSSLFFLTNIVNFFIKQIGEILMFSSAISTNLAIFWGKRKRKILLMAGKFKPATIERGNVPGSFSPSPPCPQTPLPPHPTQNLNKPQFIYTVGIELTPGKQFSKCGTN
jgi:hypothetical protein